MQSVVSDRGSFTIEASLVCTFIVIIVMNLIIMLLQTCDLCIIHEDINRRVLEIEDVYQSSDINMFYEKKIKEKSVVDIIDKIEHSKNYGIKNLLCTEIYNIDYSIDGEKLEVKVNYGFKEYGRNLLNRIVNIDNNYKFCRKFKLYSMGDIVRARENISIG